jgi:hypothetical protein
MILGHKSQVEFVHEEPSLFYCTQKSVIFESNPRPVLPIGTVGTVPRVYEGMEGRKIKIK